MQGKLSFTADWEQLNDGAPEERACFAALGIQCNNHWLTEGRDGLVNRIRNKPLLSAYHLAEWLAWNWWRLRWEPRSSTHDWAFAHRMTTIGCGYVWPNITVFSDGERTAFIAKPTEEREATAFRYISDQAAMVSSTVFESAVDEFLGQVLGQLQAEGISKTNLEQIWSELSEERRNREVAQRRKLEALLGHDPDDADRHAIERLAADAKPLGEHAVEELAAERATGGRLLSALDLQEIAEKSGFTSSPRDAVSLLSGTRLPSPHNVPAWKLGAEAARALREQEQLGWGRIENERLLDLMATERSALTEDTANRNLAFALDQNESKGVVVLRSRWRTGRRFEVARLLADRVVEPPYGKLHAATRAYTYRQKMQRSFAAEFLSPFTAVEDMLAGDYSVEAQEEVAHEFQVSERTILTMLVNHKRLDREELEEDSVAA